MWATMRCACGGAACAVMEFFSWSSLPPVPLHALWRLSQSSPNEKELGERWIYEWKWIRGDGRLAVISTFFFTSPLLLLLLMVMERMCARQTECGAVNFHECIYNMLWSMCCLWRRAHWYAVCGLYDDVSWRSMHLGEVNRNSNKTRTTISSHTIFNSILVFLGLHFRDFHCICFTFNFLFTLASHLFVVVFHYCDYCNNISDILSFDLYLSKSSKIIVSKIPCLF